MLTAICAKGQGGKAKLVFDLAKNPFTVLGVTPRTTKPEIHEAVEEAMLDADGVDTERRLNVARQVLIAPNERLRAELGYLLEMRPADARRVLETDSGQDWLEVASATEGVARTNALLQAILSPQPPDDGSEALARLFDAWEETDESEIASRINEARAIAGLSEASSRDVRRGLTELREYQANRALKQLDARTRLPQLLSKLILETLIPAGKVAEKFPAAVMAAYQREMAGALTSSADRALLALNRYVLDGSVQAFDEFKRELSAWDKLAQPLQLASEAKGADDAHSKELYEQIRQSALDLANDEDRHHDALKITDLSAEVFAELPWAAEAIQKDARDLNEILANQARNQFLTPLAAALNKATGDLARTSHNLRNHGFAAGSPDPIGAMWRGYVEILKRDVELEVRDLGARMVRSLSIELVNERSDALEAKMLIAQLLADRDWFSPDLQNQLVADERQVIINLRYQHLKDANSSGDWKRAKQICCELIEISPASEVPELRQMKQTLDQRLTSRTTSRVIWGGIAALIFGVIFLDGNQTSTDDSASDYDSALETADTAEIPADDALAGSGPTTGEEGLGSLDEDGATGEEIAPPPYTYGAFSLPQIRYCVRQNERLEFARSMVNGYAQQSRFNSEISDYNSRCGNFRYDVTEMAIVRSELSGMRSQLRSEAQELVGISVSPSPSRYAAPTENPSDPVSTPESKVEDWTAGDLSTPDADNSDGEPEEVYP